MDAMHKQRWCAIAAIALMWLAMPVWAADIMVFANRPLKSVEAFTEQLQQGTEHTVAMTTRQADLARADVVVALGGASLAALPDDFNKPLVAAFVSRQQYLEHRTKIRSAVFIEPSLEKQLRLARALLGPEQRLGVLLDSAKQWAEFIPLALPEEGQIDGIGLTAVRFVEDYDSLNHALVSLLQDSEALVGIYDTELYSATNIKNILITAYRQNVPLIGPSNAYIKAGALASLYSDLPQMAKRSVEIIEQGLQGQWPAADYNPYFHVRYNQQVARSLNMVLPDADVLAEQLSRPRQ